MEKLNFEESMKKLEEIATELESEELKLEESVKKFTEGMELSKKCKEILDEAEKKISILIDGKEENFDPTEK